jgi:hypothetical protein
MDLSAHHILARNVSVSMHVTQIQITPISSFGKKQGVKDLFGFARTSVLISNLSVIRMHLPKNEKSSAH